MATQPTTGLTYDDLRSFPEDNLRRELIDGELVVTAAPNTRHQRVVTKLVARLFAHAEAHGGEVYPAPTDVYFSETNVVEPDVLFVGPENLTRVEKAFVRSADLVVEVSSPSTRRLELVRKRELYERYGVPEYWYVDLDAERVEAHRLAQGAFGVPEITGRGQAVVSSTVPGFSIEVDDLLEPPDERAGPNGAGSGPRPR
jgi:Uma2 family endonuclease